MSRQNDIKNQIQAHSRRLQILKEQKAKHGLSVEPKIIIEIEDIEAELEKLQTARNHREMSVMTFHPYLGQGYRMERTENPASVPPQNNPDSAKDEAESKL